MKLLDSIIAALIIACLFVGYAGKTLIALLLLGLVVIVASWRFWDQSQADGLQRSGASGELEPDWDVPATPDSSGDDSSASGDGDV